MTPQIFTSNYPTGRFDSFFYVSGSVDSFLGTDRDAPLLYLTLSLQEIIFFLIVYKSV